MHKFIFNFVVDRFSDIIQRVKIGDSDKTLFRGLNAKKPNHFQRFLYSS